MNKTKIEWCDSTWNPVTGCLHGCEYCYARKIANRFGGCFKGGIFDRDKFTQNFGSYEVITEMHKKSKKGNIVAAPYPFGFEPTLHKYRLDEPQKLTKPRTIFVCSMADLFGEWVPDEWIEAVFEACEKAPQHRYLFLTKNPFRYEQLHQKGILRKSDNMWYGYSATRSKYDNWFDSQYNCFASIEPILENISIVYTDWVIIGAETGNRKNKVVPEKAWIDGICHAADEAKIPVFMKDSLIPIVGEENMRREFPR